MERIEVSDVSKLDYNSVNLINEKAQDDDIVVDFEDAKGIKSSFLDKLNKSAKIHITGPLKSEKYSQRRYYARNTYPIDVARKIFRKMEAIESKVNPNWSDLEKALFVYDTLANNMTINYDHKNDLNNESQSLAALVQGSGICAGFSSIYYEIMNRLNVKCDYVRGRSETERHAWNILTIDGKQYGVDLTWETGYRESKNIDTFRFFGNDLSFNKDHMPDDDEPEYNLSYLDKEDIIKARNNIKAKTPFDEIVRNDNSSFLLGKLGQEEVDGFTVYKYAQAEKIGDIIGKTNIIYSDNDIDSLDDAAQKMFSDVLLSKKRLDKYLSSDCSYVGAINKDRDGKYFKTINESIKDKVNGMTTSYNRDDKSNVCVSQTNKGLKLKGINNYEATEFVSIMGEPTLQNSVIYTKDDLLEEKTDKQKDYIGNELLSKHNLDFAKRKLGGYIGNTKTILGRIIKKYDKEVANTIVLEEEKKIA